MKKRFKRYCADCEELFRPTGKYAELCEKCWLKNRRSKGIRVEKRLHNVWKEREEAKAKGIKIPRLMGKWQFIYRSEKGEISLIQTYAGLKRRRFIWELCPMKKKNPNIERFATKKEAYERIRELLI